ncbi:DUF4190 domain-containing protein [Streptomyces sp. LBUM 1476]|nr:DUF4190 domain-containing protein [Streptomyces sp. LBUM 1476]MBZ3915510.1 DUF4190 domain-containing protein [Streptomyces acidiscabies]
MPPPPIAPDGPGPTPYGYPAAYAYPAPYGGAPFPGPQAPGMPGVGIPGPGMHTPGLPHPSGFPVTPPYYGWPSTPPSNGLGTSAMITGILAALGFCLWPVAFVLGILGVVLGILGRRKAARGEATNGGQALAGIICGVAGTLLSAGLAVVVIAT